MEVWREGRREEMGELSKDTHGGRTEGERGKGGWREEGSKALFLKT